MRKAVFLDREGVISELVLNKKTGECEPPQRAEDLRLKPGVIPCLRRLQDAGYDLFLVSNQPDYAKGKVTLDALDGIQKELDRLLTSQGVFFKEYYYCRHHPQGVVPGYSYACECRKPKPFFLFDARDRHSIDLRESWMVGDQDTDVECGKAAGTRTILIEEPKSASKRGKSRPDYTASKMAEATEIIINACHK
jgi:D-glycero-D-manno-heptose 1,7-bisphosphate phosphatase